jgi:hypothetical protein
MGNKCGRMRFVRRNSSIRSKNTGNGKHKQQRQHTAPATDHPHLERNGDKNDYATAKALHQPPNQVSYSYSRKTLLLYI